MSKSITVVVVKSLSYSGTTWLNLMLGSHERAFTIGPPERAWQMRNENFDNACMIHGKNCTFWPKFYEQYDPAGNFYLQLAAFSGKDFLIINNPFPQGAGQELEHPDITLKYIHFARDSRAISASYMRKYPDKTFIEAMTDFMCLGARMFNFDKNDPDRLYLRYEDVVPNQEQTIQDIGAFLGLEYPENAIRFWEHDHHISSGNGGPVFMIRLAQGLPVGGSANGDYYRAQFEQVQKEGPKKFVDARWQKELSRKDLFLLDFFCGDFQTQMGYERDRFTLAEVRQYQQEIKDAVEVNAVNTQYMPKELSEMWI